MDYDFSHLNQLPDQRVLGPIQDDEALLLYGLIRCTRISRILEVGGLEGYSAKNFLAAMAEGEENIVYTVDIRETPRISKSHKVLVKGADSVGPQDLDWLPIDLVFFDCHCLNSQLALFHKLVLSGIIVDDTTLVLHDTNLHPGKFIDGAYETEEGWVHVACERQMVNIFHELGYDCISLGTKMAIHDESLPFRHGITLCRKFKPLIL